MHIVSLAVTFAAGIQAKHVIPAATDKAGFVLDTFNASFKTCLPPSLPDTLAASSTSTACSGIVVKAIEIIAKPTLPIYLRSRFLREIGFLFFFLTF